MSDFRRRPSVIGTTWWNKKKIKSDHLGLLRALQEAVVVALAHAHHFVVCNCNREAADSANRHLPGRIVEEELSRAVFLGPLRRTEIML